MPAFPGFTQATFDFLAGLAANNDKAWFDAHRADYEAAWLAPAQAFVLALGERLAELAPGIHAEAKVNGSIFRINRDTRFSKDKTPYKEHLDLMFWLGEGRSRECPGFFFRMYADSLHVGAGMHGFEKPVLAAYRQAVLGPQGAALGEIAAALGEDFADPELAKVPRGFDPDHPRAALLRHKTIHAGRTWSPVPTELRGPEAVDFVARQLRPMVPLLLWVSALVEQSKGG